MSYRTFCSVVAVVASAFAGCATAPGGGTVQFTAADSASRGGSGITVSVDASRLSGGRHEVFLQQAGSQKIATKVWRS